MKITPEEMVRQLRAIQSKYGGDKEATHGYMDDVLVEALRQLGYGAAMNIFEDQDKWYG
jgi:hypothetical protein